MHWILAVYSQHSKKSVLRILQFSQSVVCNRKPDLKKTMHNQLRISSLRHMASLSKELKEMQVQRFHNKELHLKIVVSTLHSLCSLCCIVTNSKFAQQWWVEFKRILDKTDLLNSNYRCMKRWRRYWIGNGDMKKILDSNEKIRYGKKSVKCWMELDLVNQTHWRSFEASIKRLSSVIP